MIRRVGLLLLLPLLLAMGSAESPTWTGTLSVKGNEPFTFLALTQADGRQWRLAGEPVAAMRQRAQGLTVKVTGHPSGDDTLVVATWSPAPEGKAP
jgi:hypothetical protein